MLSKLLDLLAIDDDDDDGISAINRLVDAFRDDASSVAQRLHLVAPLSRYFDENPPALCLHILVQPPIDENMDGLGALPNLTLKRTSVP